MATADWRVVKDLSARCMATPAGTDRLELGPFLCLQNTTRGYAIVRSPGEGAAGGWSEEAGFAHTQRLNQTKPSILHLQLFWNDTPGFREREYNRRNQAEMQLLRTGKVRRTATHLDRLDG